MRGTKYYDMRVPLGDLKDLKEVTTLKKDSGTYVYYAYERKKVEGKSYNKPSKKGIGKVCEDDGSFMNPNDNFFDYFTEYSRPEEKQARSNTLSVGAYLVLKKIARDCGLDEMLKGILGDDAGLFLDLAFYSIITEGNRASAYPHYAYGHPLMTEGMRVCDDSAVSRLFSRITTDQRDEFLKLWNERFSKEEKVYISFDSTDKYCAGDVEIAEFCAHTKQGLAKPVINYAMCYDHNDRIPLFYDDYAGSIVDVSTLRYMVNTAKSYGYENAGFIIDRGYYARDNFDYMDDKGYDFIAMVKGKNALVSEHIRDVAGSFEKKHAHYDARHDVYGTTTEGYLFRSDQIDDKKRYFHVFHDDELDAFERKQKNEEVERLKGSLKKKISTLDKDSAAEIEALNDQYGRYFKVFWDEERNEPGFIELHEAVDADCEFAGYFVIVTSERMSYERALDLYRSRDAIEKVFRADKSYLGYDTLRVHSEESIDAKMFVEFVALILRCKMYSLLKDRNEKFASLKNYMCVPTARDKLEEIQMTKKSDGIYRLDHEPTKKQKDILSAFDIDTAWLKTAANNLGKQLSECD